MDNNQPIAQAVSIQSPALAQQPQVTQPVGNFYKAGVVRRYFALLIDSLFLIPFELTLYLIVAVLTRSSSADTPAVGYVNTSTLLLALFRLILLTFAPPLFFMLYNIFCIRKYGATLGKKWLKVKVVNVNGQTPSLSQVLLRETIGKILSGALFQLGYLWAIWDKNRQTWHDKLAKTYVVTTVPNNGKNPWWYCLALVLPIISILAILSVIVVLAINPIDIQRKGKDSVRLNDMARLKTAIENVQSQNPNINLCGSTLVPCEGGSDSSDPANRNIDGAGWVKVGLSKADLNPKMLTLPIDPINSQTYYYRYCSDGVNFELDARLESDQNELMMENDGGNDSNLYEAGTDLKLCRPSIRINRPAVGF